ncbi:hypothetical protein SISSUDRAFT_1035830 [Sistotremastrum suecicum HHB10207 ss-3]|uniref:Uncharacterized protein n=1 Tax=Sistotremastrum suecicum HHB10207 ss-3 TaxID=1314776 RepID=A0A166A7Y2_9AGAM|nr:hypothetical protein SISSUDRAFT_1035830 [Sistotremastrum suecicum HHB10207 ss-3]
MSYPIWDDFFADVKSAHASISDVVGQAEAAQPSTEVDAGRLRWPLRVAANGVKIWWTFGPFYGVGDTDKRGAGSFWPLPKWEPEGSVKEAITATGGAEEVVAPGRAILVGTFTLVISGASAQLTLRKKDSAVVLSRDFWGKQWNLDGTYTGDWYFGKPDPRIVA